MGRQFKVDKAINDLGGTQAGTVDDAVRLAIPRCCRFMYDITSNRGGRHDPDEINPNEMDASAMVANAAWVLAEMVRYSQRNLDLDEAKNVVDGLMKRKYPFIEEIDGRVYVDLKIATSAREVGLLVLWYRGAKRISKDELITSVERHSRRITRQNAHTAVSRLSDVVDDDGNGNLRLRASGLKEADDLIEARKGRR